MPGQLILLEPGETHHGEILGEGEPAHFLALSVSTSVVQQLAERAREGIRFPRVVVDDPSLARIFASTCRILETANDELRQQSTQLAFLAQVVRRHSSSESITRQAREDPAAVRKAREYLRANLCTNVSLRRLARLVGLSRFQLIRMFNKALGMPPHAYHVQIRIDHAKKLLSLGKAASQVALDCGFSDQSHFIRHFKRIVGVTPGSFQVSR